MRPRTEYEQQVVQAARQYLSGDRDYIRDIRLEGEHPQTKLLVTFLEAMQAVLPLLAKDGVAG